MSLRLAVIGAGAIGGLSAALAAEAGHEVAIWSPRGAPRHGTVTDGRLALRCTGALVAEHSVALLPDAAALSDWPILLLAVPGDAYPLLLPAVLAALQPGQTVICGGALSLAPLWLKEQAEARGLTPGIVAWGTTLGTGRITPERKIQVGTVRARFEAAALPADRRDALLATCVALFGDRFSAVDSLLLPLLSNINPVAHAGQVIPNLSRIERHEAWQLFEHFGEAGGRIAAAIDAERIAIATVFGQPVRSLARHYHLSYHVPEGPLPAIAAAIEADGRAPRGPVSLDHRYLDEDMPYGLAVYEVLGRIAAVPTPQISAALTLLSCASGKELRQGNPLIAWLGLEGMDVAGLRARCG
ncbi:NAD/NADP octopine/nopaline dehydrogenase family protein [Humitalea sp. 24SJ18S-53]|uniref:NAD/NADP octopine/nopaline dehydrogenase family protein n=1 Tax=Humitalea sp. 24SJ18S-53 TaxID=3422307 RepID=UPI003D6785F0